MASKFLRKQMWWIKLHHPITGRVIRESLETRDEIRAELLRASIELRARLLEPRFGAVELPAHIHERLGLPPERAPAQGSRAPVPQDVATPQQAGAPSPVAPQPERHSANVEEAVQVYLKFIATENAPPHIANKLSMLRRFLGDARMDRVNPAPANKRITRKTAADPAPREPLFKGNHLHEITPALVQDFIEGLGELPPVI